MICCTVVYQAAQRRSSRKGTAELSGLELGGEISLDMANGGGFVRYVSHRCQLRLSDLLNAGRRRSHSPVQRTPLGVPPLTRQSAMPFSLRRQPRRPIPLLVVCAHAFEIVVEFFVYQLFSILGVWVETGWIVISPFEEVFGSGGLAQARSNRRSAASATCRCPLGDDDWTRHAGLAA